MDGAKAPAVLLVDLADEAEPDVALGDLVRRCGPATRVLALGTTNDVTLFRRLAARGIADYLLKPVSSEVPCDALRRAARSEAEASDPKRRARIHAVIGARGGVGASTLALSLAWLLSQEHKLSTALIDLDLHFGNLALSLDLEPGRGLAGVEHPERTDGLLLASAMVKGDERLRSSPLRSRSQDMLRFEPEGATALLDALAQDYDFLMVDLPRTLDAATRHVLTAADATIIVTDLSLAALRDASPQRPGEGHGREQSDHGGKPSGRPPPRRDRPRGIRARPRRAARFPGAVRPQIGARHGGGRQGAPGGRSRRQGRRRDAALAARIAGKEVKAKAGWRRWLK